jgi:hypothetical protein
MGENIFLKNTHQLSNRLFVFDLVRALQNVLNLIGLLSVNCGGPNESAKNKC